MELADSDTNATPVVKTKGIGEYISSHLRQYGLLFALIAVMAFFEVVTDGTLLRAVNITNLLLQNSYIIIMALGMLIVIVSGNIDLSVGSVMGFIGALAAVMIVNYGQSPYITMIVCLAIGGLIGAAQGYWVAYWKIPSFIVTLAGMLVFRGLSLWLLEGQSVGRSRRNSRSLPPVSCRHVSGRHGGSAGGSLRSSQGQCSCARNRCRGRSPCGLDRHASAGTEQGLRHRG